MKMKFVPIRSLWQGFYSNVICINQFFLAGTLIYIVICINQFFLAGTSIQMLVNSLWQGIFKCNLY